MSTLPYLFAVLRPQSNLVRTSVLIVPVHCYRASRGKHDSVMQESQCLSDSCRNKCSHRHNAHAGCAARH